MIAPARDPGQRLSRLHLPALDGLRGVAIVTVVCHNLVGLEAPSGRAVQIIDMVLNRGWIGVQLFFVMSGFLITGILLDTRRDNRYLRNFMIRRMLRIFPLYYVSLVLLLIVLPRFGPQVAACEVPGSWSPYFLFFSNWTQPFLSKESDCVDQFWSLAVEEQFYLLWPLLIYCCPPRRALALSMAVALAAPLIRMVMLAQGVEPQAVYQFTVCRMDALALGAAAACAWRVPGWRERLGLMQGRLLWLSLAVAVAGLIATRGYPRISPSGQIVGYFVSSLSLSLLILGAASADLNSGRRALTSRLLHGSFLRMMGRYSYGIYVVHKPVSFLIWQPLIAAWPLPWLHDSRSLASTLVFALLVGALSLALAMVSYALLEKPFLSLKPRLTSARPGSGGTVGDAAG